MTSSDIASNVRRNAGPAAVAAFLLIYFGFFYLAKPTGNDLFAWSATVFYYTIRIGGIALAVIAVWSWLGHRTVLAVDAAVSVAIGVLLIATGAGLLAGGGAALQTILNVVFGAMFISAGVRNWREYVELADSRAPLPSDHGRRPDAPHPMERCERPSTPPGPSLASQLRHRMADQADRVADAQREAVDSESPLPAPGPSTGEGPGRAGSTPTPTDESEGCDESLVERPARPDREPPPDGYLASLADDGPPPRP